MKYDNIPTYKNPHDKIEPVQEPEIETINKNVLTYGGLIAFIILLFLVASSIFIFLDKEDGIEYAASPLAKDSGDVVESSLTPTPFPFQEMTIPYLRSREFRSKLEELEEFSQNSNYTTYITSFDSDGFRVNGLLTVPAESATALIEQGGGFPAIVFVHGYIPPAEYRTTEKYEDYIDYLARNGFVVFKIDLRGHGDSEGEPGGGYYSGDYVVDVLNARAALRDYELVDADRIGLWGHSMAGNVVARAMAAAPEISAVSIWGGAVYTYSDFSEYNIEDSSYRPPSEDSEPRKERNKMFEMYGSFDPASEFWRMVPMTNYLDEIEGAIQLNHATNDDVVDVRYSRNLASILEEADIKHELIEYQTGGHNITGTAFVSAMGNTVRFFRENL